MSKNKELARLRQLFRDCETYTAQVKIQQKIQKIEKELKK